MPVDQDRLSKTAAFIAIKFYSMTLEKPYRELFDEDTLLFYERLVANLPEPLNRFYSLLHNKSIKTCCTYINDLLLPGDLMHVISRKFFINEKVDRLLEQGFEQLVMLGAGFDHISTKYAARNVSCFEIDTPAMTEVKRRFIQENGYNSSKLELQGAHLHNESVSGILSSLKGLKPDKRTIVIAEGFFDYLSPAEAKNVLTGVTTFFNSELAWISTVFALEELSSFHRIMFKSGVKMSGEQLKLHFSIDDYFTLFKANGLTVREKLSAISMNKELPVFSNNSYNHLPGFYLIEAVKN